MSWLGDHRLAATGALAAHPALAGNEILRIRDEEGYAASLVRVNDRVLIARGYPNLERDLRAPGLATLALDLTGFRKVDDDLSCLSLRF